MHHRLLFLLAWPAALVPPAHAAAPSCTLSVASDADIAARNGFAALAPGSTVCIAPGRYLRQLPIVGAKGTAAAPILFVVLPATGRAVFGAGLLLRGASHVSVSGLEVTLDPQLGPGAAVTLDVGASDNVVRGLTVHGAYVGITIGSSAGPAGAGNLVAANVVRDNWNTGIAVGELSDGTPQSPNVIERNVVSGSGGHGIEINDANFIAVRDNVVQANGTGVNSVRQGGYSGIHLFSRERSTPASAHGLRTAHNVVSGNTVQGTRERSTRQPCDDGSGSGVCTDGNGIQVDRFASHNDIVANTVTGNAGAGISIYGAADNLVKDNVARGNNQQEGRRRFFPGPAEIALSAVNLPPGSTSGNTVVGNTAVTTVYKIPAFYLSGNAGRNRIDSSNRWQRDLQAIPDPFWGPVYVGSTWHSAESAQRAFAEAARQ
jgi:parallel beta-helix repeat protein